MTIRGAILDVDGTVLRGTRALPGAAAALAALDERGVRRLFFSNNPTKPPSAYVERFAGAGLDVAAAEVMTAGVVTARYLRECHADDHVYLVGEPGLRDLLDAAGVRIVGTTRSEACATGTAGNPLSGGPTADTANGSPADVDTADVDAADVDVVVASLDRRFGYGTLVTALRLLADGDTTFLGTDPDMVIPAAVGNRPGSGAIIHAISGVTGREPDRVLGKPSAEAREMALGALDVPPESCLVVGDRLDTDIALGSAAGMTTVLVRTGVTDATTLERSPIEPDYTLDSIGDLPPLLDAL